MYLMHFNPNHDPKTGRFTYSTTFISGSSKSTKTVDSGKYKPDTDEWRAEKDIFMSKIADKGLAIVLENGGAGATRDNVKRLIDQNKEVKVYELGSDEDRWVL